MHGSATRDAGSLHLLRDFSQIAHASAGHSESSGAAANFRPVLDLTHRARWRNAVDQQGPSRRGGRSGYAKGLGSVHDSGARVPSRPGAARLPEPTISVEVGPGTITIGRPPPRVSGDPGISGSRIPHPGAVHEGIPTGSDQIGLPHHSVAGNVVEAAVVAQVAAPVRSKAKNY